MTLTRSVSWESIRVFIACNTTYWGFYCWPLLIQADKIKWIGRKETRGGGERNIGHDSGLIEYDQMIEGLCKKKSVVNKRMLLFIIKKVTAQITTKFVTIHQITSLSGPGITMFGGNQSTLPEINGRMRTFIINSYQSINKRSVTFREERTVPMYTLVSQKKPHNYWRLVAS